MLMKDDMEHAVPEAWRPTFRRIANAFAAGDFQLGDNQIDCVAPLDAAMAEYISDNVAAYGGTLAPLNDATWDRSIYRWMGDYWQILVDLSTNEEVVSDLTLHARLYEVDGFRLVIDSVHVP